MAGSSSLSTRATLGVLKDMKKIQLYIKSSFDELFKKVTWPSWPELQSSSIVVAISTVIIALIIYLMDKVFSTVLDLYYSLFG